MTAEIEILEWKPSKHGGKLGSFNLRIGDFRFYNCGLFQTKQGRTFFNFPTIERVISGEKRWIEQCTLPREIKEVIIKDIVEKIKEIDAEADKPDPGRMKGGRSASDTFEDIVPF